MSLLAPFPVRWKTIPISLAINSNCVGAGKSFNSYSQHKKQRKQDRLLSWEGLTYKIPIKPVSKERLSGHLRLSVVLSFGEHKFVQHQENQTLGCNTRAREVSLQCVNCIPAKTLISTKSLAQCINLVSPWAVIQFFCEARWFAPLVENLQPESMDTSTVSLRSCTV